MWGRREVAPDGTTLTEEESEDGLSFFGFDGAGAGAGGNGGTKNCKGSSTLSTWFKKAPSDGINMVMLLELFSNEVISPTS
ncbi:hypothetical protein H5410_053607 [Solanum commersonii]|uniref:Uncharacterized protein n=1 Tax=Solanum commersonii TaxID=4109 RepID=A0A9J5X6T9_SOLCO|nr:hypothetical protein H5410_053607 [Solanum commersonii]